MNTYRAAEVALQGHAGTWSWRVQTQHVLADALYVKVRCVYGGAHTIIDARPLMDGRDDGFTERLEATVWALADAALAHCVDYESTGAAGAA